MDVSQLPVWFLTLLTAASVVVAEVRGKAQLSLLVLTSCFRRPAPIVVGRFVATILNQFATAWLNADCECVSSSVV